MDIKQVQELIRFVSRSGVNEVSIEEKDFKITIKTNQAPTYVTASMPAPVQMQHAPAAAPQAGASKEPKVSAEKAPVSDEENVNYVTIKSPMIGTFYRSSSPDKPFFINVGDEIKAGQVICIIEAMKLFNEIEAEVSGKVVKVLIDNSSPVEYDQPLFIIEPA